ncbi:MAG: ABC transporter permease [Methanophagales archaeon]|nr:ABC transporter permease [Methanophagales archaeon]
MKDIFLLAYRDIKERKARTSLTLLGIAVGIAAVIALMSVGYGFEQSVTGELVEMVDLIFVMPGKANFGNYMELGSFNERDLKDVERIGGVKEAAAMISGMEEVEYRGEKTVMRVIGIDTRDISAIFGEVVKTGDGRDLRDNDHKACLIGHSIANDYFDEEIGVNDRLNIGGSKFRVVGVLEKQGGFRSDVDSSIYITERDAKSILGNDEIAQITVRVRDIGEAELIAEEIEERIDENHKLDDFTSAMTMGSAIVQLKTIFTLLQAVLVAIASISLIVASIGIMNTMLMSVMERTHEIGIMKAIGAKNRNVLSLFLLESGMVSVAGGVCGCVLGIIGANVISIGIGAAFGEEIPAILRPEVLLGGIVVAVIVGVLSGLYPARKASKMSPVEAVRYE